MKQLDSELANRKHSKRTKYQPLIDQLIALPTGQAILIESPNAEVAVSSIRSVLDNAGIAGKKSNTTFVTRRIEPGKIAMYLEHKESETNTQTDLQILEKQGIVMKPKFK
jgi:hypothetical protein